MNAIEQAKFLRNARFPRPIRRVDRGDPPAMDRAGLDVLLVHSLPNICYLTGFQTPLSDWYHCLILPRDGEPVLQVCDPDSQR